MADVFWNLSDLIVGKVNGDRIYSVPPLIAIIFDARRTPEFWYLS